ncbi:MAG TPA: ABC transporter permease [Vicinamibacterales bacterium]|nr:ABC transporter permease [Vicinamibacterales bacterium]
MTWWRRVLNRSRLEAQLHAEVSDHFDRLVGEFIQRGHSETEARRLARLEFGGLDQVKEACRDARGTRWLDETAQDVRYGMRGFRKQPGFTVVAVLTLAIGVGANLAIFNVFDAVLLRELPVPRASELISMRRWINGTSGSSFSYPQVELLSDRSDLFTALCGIGSDTVYVGPPDSLEPVGAAWVSGRYFDTLELTPLLGRLLTSADDVPGVGPVVVLSHDYWRRRFGSDPRIVGQTLTIEGQPVPIVGVTPRGFSGATVGERADLTLAIQARAGLQPENKGFTGPGSRWIRVLARPVPGLTHEQLQARLDVAWPQIVENTLSPGTSPESRARALTMTVRVEPGAAGTSQIRTSLRFVLIVAMALVTLVLVVACVNVANLLLARGATRAREMALRLAIGATRTRIVRQLLIESAMLAAAGVAGGLLLGWLSSSALVDLMGTSLGGPDSSSLALDTAPNWRLVSVSAGIGLAITLLFGLMPAWRVSAIAPGVVSAGARIAESHSRLASALIVAQVSLSLVLVIGAVLFTRSLSNLRSLDRGFVPDGVLLARFDPSRALMPSPELVALNRSLLAAAAELPGVTGVSAALVTPLQGGGMSQAMNVGGVSTGLEEVHYNIIAPRYFEVLGTPMLAGRDFTDADDTTAPGAAIVNEAFVRKYFSDGHALGQHLTMSGPARDLAIVGIVKDAVYETLREPAPPTVYASYLQSRGRPMTLIVASTAPMATVSRALRDLIQPRTPAKPVRIDTLASQLEASLFSERLVRLLTTVFGMLALGLAAIGLYGLMSYSVVTRTREIGVRLALGARPSRVMGLVLARAMRMVVLGVLIGLPLAWMSSRLISRLSFGVSAMDPVAIGAAIAILAAGGVAASALPARRAATVDPVTAIQSE